MAGTFLVASQASTNTSKVLRGQGDRKECVLYQISQRSVIDGVEIHKTLLARGCSEMVRLRAGLWDQTSSSGQPELCSCGQVAISLILSLLIYKLRIIMRPPGSGSEMI